MNATILRDLFWEPLPDRSRSAYRSACISNSSERLFFGSILLIGIAGFLIILNRFFPQLPLDHPVQIGYLVCYLVMLGLSVAFLPLRHLGWIQTLFACGVVISSTGISIIDSLDFGDQSAMLIGLLAVAVLYRRVGPHSGWIIAASIGLYCTSLIFLPSQHHDDGWLVTAILNPSIIYVLARILRTNEIHMFLDQVEKTMLMQELEHRVKNNLMFVSGLLVMEADNLVDDQAKLIFEKTQTRILAISHMYELLVQTTLVNRVSTQDYLEHLVAAMRRTYGSERLQIRAEVDACDIEVEKAMNIGLIVNELITDAIRHAFPDGRLGQVLIQLTASRDRLRLVVRDNGVGLPAGFDPLHSSGTGFQLIRMLASQLGGTVVFSNNAGLTTTIDFPRS